MKTQLRQSTVDALRAVGQAIAIDEGRSFDMRQWAGTAVCGTTLCIAGHMLSIAGFTPLLAIDDEAEPYEFSKGEFTYWVSSGLMAVYGIDSEAAVFHVQDWPARIRTLYNRGDRVAAAQAAIEWYIGECDIVPDAVEIGPLEVVALEERR